LRIYNEYADPAISADRKKMGVDGTGLCMMDLYLVWQMMQPCLL